MPKKRVTAITNVKGIGRGRGAPRGRKIMTRSKTTNMPQEEDVENSSSASSEEGGRGCTPYEPTNAYQDIYTSNKEIAEIPQKRKAKCNERKCSKMILNSLTL